METMFRLLVIETVLLSLVGGYITWQLWGVIEKKLEKKNDFKMITYKEWKK